MTATMNAAVVRQFGSPLILEEWDVPAPGPDQILIKTEACGVCHTDLHATKGDWPLKPTLPFAFLWSDGVCRMEFWRGTTRILIMSLSHWHRRR